MIWWMYIAIPASIALALSLLYALYVMIRIGGLSGRKP